MKVWGLTGGIGSGKSTVTRMFEAHGVRTVNADTTYHDLLQPSQGHSSPLASEVAAAFPEESLLRPDGSLDRTKLGARVFRDAAARQRLESITHPAVAGAVAGLIDQLRSEGIAHVLYDVPLLFERQLQNAFHGVIVVWVPPATQLSRILSRDSHLSSSDAESRIRAQLPLDDKRALGRWVVDNSGSLEATAGQVDLIWSEMQTSS